MTRQSISGFFRAVLAAPLKNTRWSWGSISPSTSRVFLRVWEDEEHDVGGGRRVEILGESWEGHSAGYKERQRHIDLLEAGAEGFGVRCIAVDTQAVPRKIKTFSQDRLLRFGQVVREGAMTYAAILGEVSTQLVAKSATSSASLARDLAVILAKNVGPTTRAGEMEARVGQGMFRQRVLALWGYRCAVTGAVTTEAIRASHVKPWSESSDAERLDPENGLPLVATLDALFDEGLITFEADGTGLVSPVLPPDDMRRLGVPAILRLRRAPSQETIEYLEYHRQFRFKR